jgi:hypothetical protein
LRLFPLSSLFVAGAIPGQSKLGNALVKGGEGSETELCTGPGGPSVALEHRAGRVARSVQDPGLGLALGWMVTRHAAARPSLRRRGSRSGLLQSNGLNAPVAAGDVERVVLAEDGVGAPAQRAD